jgi:hypothetical protein
MWWNVFDFRDMKLETSGMSFNDFRQRLTAEADLTAVCQ